MLQQIAVHYPHIYQCYLAANSKELNMPHTRRANLNHARVWGFISSFFLSSVLPKKGPYKWHLR